MDGFAGYFLTQAREELVMILFLWVPLLTLAAVCVTTLNCLEPQRRA